MVFALEVQRDRRKHVRKLGPHKHAHNPDLHSKHVRRRLPVLLVLKTQDRLIIRRHQDRAMIPDLAPPLEVLAVVRLEAFVRQEDNNK